MSDKPSEFPTVRRGNAGADDNPTISARLAQTCYVLVCLQILFFSYLSLVDQNIYNSIIVEDALIEYLTVVVFLLAGIPLFAAALMDRRRFPRCGYIIGGIMMMFFAGEEITWGQRIIGFEAPDFLVSLNDQGEFNIHNIRAFDHFKFQRHVLFALCIAASAAFLCRKGRIFGILLPPIFLTLAILATMSYTYIGRVELLEIPRFIVSEHRGLLLLLLMFALFSRNARLFIATTVPMSLALATSYLFSQNYYNFYLGRIWHELFEYILAHICFFYALAVLLDNAVARQKMSVAVAALKLAAALPSMFIKSPPPPPTNTGRFSLESSGAV